MKNTYENDTNSNSNKDKDKVNVIAQIIIKLFERKRSLLQEIILLKSAFSIIDQMFHKEIKDAEDKRSSLCYSGTVTNPEDMNDFIKNLMDPFANYNNSKATKMNNCRELYYEEDKKLYQ